MKQTIIAEKKNQSTKINRAGYILFLALVLFQIINGEYDWALANMGIALIFDPFAPLKWEERSKTQKAFIYTHLVLMAAGAAFIYLF